ncbi:MAG: 16S rRNA (guanine(527)-N(7))-methyltransferase RsmG [Flavobacteriaceae bacterium]
MSAADRRRGEALALIRRFTDVSRETEERLDRYAALLVKWQKVKNLVGPRTLDDLWMRHIADSAQLIAYIAPGKRIVDLGAGAGLPGIVLSILISDSDPKGHVHLVEANSRKAAFLLEAVRQLSLPASVHAERIETFSARADRFDYVTARALAPLKDLVAMSAGWVENGATGLFLKGQDVDEEIAALSRYGNLSYEKHVSLTDPSGCVLELRQAAAAAPS